MTDTERETLCARIDELCAELSRTQLNRDMWLTRAKVTLNRLSVTQAENAKLHSLCAEVAGILFNLVEADYCSLCDRDDINHPCPVHTVKGGECLIESELREMGIGVD